MPDDEDTTLPYAPGSATSQAAAEAAVPHERSAARRILDAIEGAGDQGYTRDELVLLFESSIINTSVTGRIRNLVYSGLVSEGPDERLTRSGRGAYILRRIVGTDFDTLYRSPPPGARHQRTAQEQAFLDRSIEISQALVARQINDHEAQSCLWEAFQESIAPQRVPVGDDHEELEIE